MPSIEKYTHFELRTKQYMANTTFSSRQVWLPKYVALQRLGSGGPAGRPVLLSAWGVFIERMKVSQAATCRNLFHCPVQELRRREQWQKIFAAISASIAPFFDLTICIRLLTTSNNGLMVGWSWPHCRTSLRISHSACEYVLQGFFWYQFAILPIFEWNDWLTLVVVFNLLRASSQWLLFNTWPKKYIKLFSYCSLYCSHIVVRSSPTADIYDPGKL